MNNQNNNISNNQISENNPIPEVIILMVSSDNQCYAIMKESINESAKRNCGNVIEIIESEGCDDYNALDKLISLVNSYDYTALSPILLVEDRLVESPVFSIFATVLYTLNLTKPIKFKIFQSTAVRFDDEILYVTKLHPSDEYISYISRREKKVCYKLLLITLYPFTKYGRI